MALTVHWNGLFSIFLSNLEHAAYTICWHCPGARRLSWGAFLTPPHPHPPPLSAHLVFLQVALYSLLHILFPQWGPGSSASGLVSQVATRFTCITKFLGKKKTQPHQTSWALGWTQPYSSHPCGELLTVGSPGEHKGAHQRVKYWVSEPEVFPPRNPNLLWTPQGIVQD